MSSTRRDIEPDGNAARKDVEPDGFSSRKAIEEDDVEGHSMLISPTLGRDLDKARSAEIDRTVRGKQQEAEAKRVYHK
ncbi:MAG TPA: hypothetical protein VIH37_13570 [Candidatus Limnocylindrales bacterium]